MQSMIDNSEESLLINPEELRRKRTQRIVDDIEQDKKSIEGVKDKLGKIYNKGGQVAVNYETCGRFTMPPILYFKDFTISHVNDLTLSRQEDLLENLVVVLQQIKNEDATVNVEDMLIEEFLETLIGVKMEFNTPIHIHPWICECQNNIQAELQKVNESEIDLRTLKYKSILEVDEEMKAYFKSLYDEMADQEFIDYLRKKYDNDPNMSYVKNAETIDKEVKQIKIKEPITVTDELGNAYSFRFLRVKDLLNAQKLSENKYASKIHALKNKKYSNESLVSSKMQKEKEIDNVKYQQEKDIILFARAFSLIKYNGKELTAEESINIYKKAPRSILMQITEFMDKLQFGIFDERELTCPECGEVRKRLLRQDINPYELLPLDVDTKREQRKHSKLNVCFAV
jgi:hypothetical protein